MAVFVGFALAWLAMVSAAAIAAFVPLAMLPSPHRICIGTGFDAAACAASAARIGVLCAASVAVAGLLTFGAFIRSRQRKIPVGGAGSGQTPLTDALVAAVAALLIAHLTVRQLAPAYAGRLDELSVYSVYISLENLAWPLLLQVLAVEREATRRIGLFALLVTIAAVSPFRATLLAIAVFGLLIPAVRALWQSARVPPGAGRRHALNGLGLGALAAALLASGIWSSFVDRSEQIDSLPPSEIEQIARLARAHWQSAAATDDTNAARAPARPADSTSGPATAGRKTVAVPNVSPAEAPGRSALALFRTAPGEALLQRVATPAFQAAVLERYGQSHRLPGIAEGILYKLHLGHSPPLNRILYAQLYGPSLVGQTTTLTYGEALAYFPGPPAIWLIAAPLLLGLGWVVLRVAGFDAQVLFGIAVWRSSAAGLVAILPALAVQVAVFVAMRRAATRWERCSPTARRRLAAAACASAAAGLALLAVAVAWSAAADLQRKTIWRVAVAAPREACAFVDGHANVGAVNRALLRRGLTVRAAIEPVPVVPNGPIQMYILSIPDGNRAQAFAADVLGALRGLLRCSDGRPPTAPAVMTEGRVPGGGALPLSALASIAAGIAAALCAAAAVKRDRCGSREDRPHVR